MKRAVTTRRGVAAPVEVAGAANEGEAMTNEAKTKAVTRKGPTPGPWQVVPITKGLKGKRPVVGNFDLNARVADIGDSGMTVAELNANAVLISAAPDMLAALKRALAAMDHMGDVLNAMDAVEDEDVAATTATFAQVRAAIAKAEGK